MSGGAPAATPYYSGAKQDNINTTEYYKKLIAEKAKRNEELSRTSNIPTRTPTEDEWHYLNEDAKRKWQEIMGTDYSQAGNIYPGMTKVQKLNPDIEATQNYLDYAPPGEYGQFVAIDGGNPIRGYEYYQDSKHKQVGGNTDQYYTARAFASGADPWASEWQFDPNNPLYKALWQKNAYRDDYFDTQAMGQQEDLLSGQLAAYQRQLMPDYGYNFNTAKVAQAGGK